MNMMNIVNRTGNPIAVTSIVVMVGLILMMLGGPANVAAQEDPIPRAHITVELSSVSSDRVSWSDPDACPSDYHIYGTSGTHHFHLGSVPSGSTEATVAITDGEEIALYCGAYDSESSENVLVASTGISQDHSAEGTYSSAPLTALSISPGTLSPTFDRGIYDYAVDVPSDVSVITLAPTVLSGYETDFIKNPRELWGFCVETSCSYSFGGDALSDADTETPGFQVNLDRGENRLGLGVHRGSDDFILSVELYRLTVTVQNSPAMGQPAVDGTVRVGRTLVADTSLISDIDGLDNVSFSYQWLTSGDTEISGATNESYTLVAADQGKQIMVRVTFTDDSGYDETLTSVPTDAVVAGNAATGAPTISGTARVGETLAVDTSGIADADGLTSVSFAFRWIRHDPTTLTDTEIDGAAISTYTAQIADVGKAIKVKVSFTDDEGDEETLTSDATAAVSATVPEAPSRLIVLLSDTEKLNLFWDAPSSNGGAAITGYKIQWKKSWDSWDTPVEVSEAAVTGTTHTVSGLTDGIQYSFRVFAINSVGYSTASPVRIGTPRDPTTTVARAHITVELSSGLNDRVSWSDPSGCPFDYHVYRATSYYQGSRHWHLGSAPSGSTEATVGITSGEVIAVYCGEHDRESSENVLVASTTVNRDSFAWGTYSSAPLTGLTISAGTLSPTFDRGIYIYSVEVPSDVGVITLEPTVLDGYETNFVRNPMGAGLRLCGLTCVYSYGGDMLSDADTETSGFQVNLDRGENRLGLGVDVGPYDHTFSTELYRLTVTVQNSPANGQPAISGVARLGQTLVADTSGISDIDGLENVSFSYQWLTTGDTEISEATNESYTLVAADQGNQIKVRVSFTDDVGNAESLTSAPTIAVVAAAVPEAPRSLEVQPAGTGEISVSWEAPAPDGGATVTGYTIQWKEVTGSWDSTSDVSSATITGTSYTITSLSLGVEYSIRVIATNSVGDGPASAEESATAVAQTSQQQAATSNAPATGAPAITGTAQVGETLTADTLGIADEDGLDNVSFTYQWVVNDGTSDANVEDASGATYTLTSDDEGNSVKVQVTFTDDAGNAETLTSEPTATVAAAPTLLTASVHHVPESHNGQDVFTFELRFSETPEDDFSYKTLRDQAFTVTGGDVVKARRIVPGENVRWEITVEPRGNGAATVVLPETTDCADQGAICTQDGRKLSGSLEVTVPLQNSGATGAPTIRGIARVGETLTARTSGISDVDGVNGDTVVYQWIANDGASDTEISGATGFSYTLVEADVGKTVKVRVSFTDLAGNAESLTSAATSSVAGRPNSAARGAPTISGTAQVGETLSASTSGISDSDGLTNATFTYQWLSSRDTEIVGATGSTYTLKDTDEGKAIKVRISFTDDRGNPETLTSAATGAVAARPNSPAVGVPAIGGTAQVGETLTASTSGISDSDGMDNASFSYQWLADYTDIVGATGASYTLTDSDEAKAVKVRVSFTDDAGNDELLTSAPTKTVTAAPTPLTASIHDAPESHDGQNAFTFELRFSEEFELSYITLRDHAFTVTGGSVTKARRLQRDSDEPNRRWEITIEPESNASLTIVLPVPTDCDDQGAVCTGDGRKLSNRLELTVSGPSS